MLFMGLQRVGHDVVTEQQQYRHLYDDYISTVFNMQSMCVFGIGILCLDIRVGN